MPTMILVEDESFERQSLIHHIDWELIGVEIVGEAVNGEQGLARTMELRPDIVLSDVNMPVMNGIEMARKIRAVAPETRILFLSAYDDFDYAKQAIDLSVQAYVMKPVNESELLHVVKRVADDITEKALEKRLLSNIRTNYSASLQLARQALVNRMLIGVPVGEKDMQKLNLEWLCAQESNISLLITIFGKGHMENFDEALEQLNQRCQKICAQSINICMDVGRLITLCGTFERGTALTAKVAAMLREFFRELGDACVRVESVNAEGGGQSVAELYTAFLARHMGSPAENSPASQVRKSKQQITNEVEKIINEEYKQPLVLEDIARRLHFTPNYLGTVFKSVKKISVNRQLMQLRMAEVRHMLLESDLPVNDIAALCGFGSITYFHTAFKKEHGLTPNEYRHQNQRGM